MHVTKLTRARHVGLAMTLGLLVSCTGSTRDDANGPTEGRTERVSSPPSPPPSSSPSHSEEPLPQTPRASSVITLPVGHCWIDPVRFDGMLWAVVRRDQFGYGGGTPNHLEGRGRLTRLSETRSLYRDDGGPVLRLVPATQPMAASVFKGVANENAPYTRTSGSAAVTARLCR